MAARRSGNRAILLVAVLLPAAAAWLLWPNAGDAHDTGERGSGERAAAAPSRPASTGAGRSGELPAPQPVARTGEEGPQQSSLWVSVTAEPGARGAAAIVAGEDAQHLEAHGSVGVGHTKELTVPAATRLWRIEPIGELAPFYEPVEVRHDPGAGPLTVHLPRGKVSIRARVRDEAGLPIPSVTLALGTVGPIRAGVFARESDENGDVEWAGLVGALAEIPGLAAEPAHGLEGFASGGAAPVVWDEQRLQGKVEIVFRRRGMFVELPRVALAGGFLEKQSDAGAWVHEGWPGWLAHTTASATTRGSPEPLTFASRRLVPGTYRMTLRGEDDTLLRAAFELAEGTLTTVPAFETLRPEMVPGRLEGAGIGRIRHLVLTDIAARTTPPWAGRWEIPVAADGTFAVPRVEGVRAVRLEGTARSREVFVVPRVFSLEAERAIVVATVQGVRAAGTVRDAQGRPVPSAFIYAVARPSNRDAWQRSHPDWFEAGVEVRARTDAEGRFESEPGLPGAWIFSVQQGLHAPRVESPAPVQVLATAGVPIVLTVPLAK